MFARPSEGIPPALARPRRRSRARRLILAGVAILILLAGFEIGIRQVSPDARTVADLYTRINDLPTVGYSAFYRCPAPQSNTVYYHVDFMRAGVLIEGAGLVEKDCSVWDVVGNNTNLRTGLTPA